MLITFLIWLIYVMLAQNGILIHVARPIINYEVLRLSSTKELCASGFCNRACLFCDRPLV
jgi:hypothetical protein